VDHGAAVGGGGEPQRKRTKPHSTASDVEGAKRMVLRKAAAAESRDSLPPVE
jgi:hypothetical protein